jgi:hypothetical protein
MSYPQPIADTAGRTQADFFRITTPLSSPGDIYESTMSSLAFGVGPESDIANVQLCYFDATKNTAANHTFMSFATVSPTRTFVGRLDANQSQNYTPADRKGRIFFWSDNIYDPNYRPSGFNPAINTIEFVAPVLDVIQYFQPAQSLQSARLDKQFQFLVFRSTFLVVPYYGRKYCYVDFTNRNATDSVPFSILGVNYVITQDNIASPPPYHQETTILPTTTIAPGASHTTIITATGTGMFDALVFGTTVGGPTPLRIVVSDDMA